MKILVVDDDRLSRRIIERFLESLGYLVVTAENGEAALIILQQEIDISVVITDWMMPVMDGLELCRRARDFKWKRYLNIILLTSRGEKEDLIEGLNAGADAFVSKPLNFAELQAHLMVAERTLDLEQKLSMQLDELILAHHQLQEAHAKIEEIAHMDELTGLFNRRHIMQCLSDEFARAKRYSSPVSIFIMDLDHFKIVNDSHGHPAGDAVLREAGRILREAIRETDIIGRYGGEEFLGILPETETKGAVILAERICQGFQSFPFPVSNSEHIQVTVSLGVSSFQPEQHDSDALLFEADQALYDAKKAGRNRVCTR